MMNEQLCEGPRLGGCKIQYNNWQHLYVVDGRIIPLSPTEYNLFMLLYQRAIQVQQRESSDGFVSFEELEESLNYGVSHRCLTRHMGNVRNKIEASTPFYIGCDVTLGYILVTRSPIGNSALEQRRYKKNYTPSSVLACTG